MKLYTNVGQNFICGERTELKGLKVLFGIYTFFIISSIVMPQYFGIHIGYDITCARLSNLLLIGYLIINRPLATHFCRIMFRCEVFIPICCYLLVAGYTMVFRVEPNAFFIVFFEILSFFMMIYGIRYVIGYKRAIKWIVGCAYFLGIYGLIEFAYGRSLFLQFLRTVPTPVKNAYRSGHYRIMGPCGHSLGYGLVLILFIAIICIDLKKNEINLFKRPVLLILLLANVFLTGSRSALGYALLEVALLFLFSNKSNKVKSLLILFLMCVFFGIFLLLFHNTGIGRYLLGQLASVIDQVLNTTYAANFGVEVQRLQDSENYRKVLPLIFTLDWLNPLLGRGTKGFNGAEINGMFIQSIDNYYVIQYIKYAYPGLVAYILFMVVMLVVMIRDLIKRQSVITKAVLIGSVLYFWNLWWVDTLQTLKYVYIVLAIFYAEYLESKEVKDVLAIETKKVYGERDNECER